MGGFAQNSLRQSAGQKQQRAHHWLRTLRSQRQLRDRPAEENRDAPERRDPAGTPGLLRDHTEVKLRREARQLHGAPGGPRRRRTTVDGERGGGNTVEEGT